MSKPNLVIVKNLKKQLDWCFDFDSNKKTPKVKIDKKKRKPAKQLSDKELSELIGGEANDEPFCKTYSEKNKTDMAIIFNRLSILVSCIEDELIKNGMKIENNSLYKSVDWRK